MVLWLHSLKWKISANLTRSRHCNAEYANVFPLYCIREGVSHTMKQSQDTSHLLFLRLHEDERRDGYLCLFLGQWYARMSNASHP